MLQYICSACKKTWRSAADCEVCPFCPFAFVKVKVGAWTPPSCMEMKQQTCQKCLATVQMGGLSTLEKCPACKQSKGQLLVFPELHQAVLAKDVSKVRTLISEAAQTDKRPIDELDELKRSPIDLLDAMSLDPVTSKELRHELLASKNPTAPDKYEKWEAGHGSPWGIEILRSKKLLAGVNDPKGGNESLEKMVFFSDRTPEHSNDKNTRSNLRIKARSYASGKGYKSSSAANRALQYRMSQAIKECINTKQALSLTGAQVIATAGPKSEDEALKEQLQERLTTSAMTILNAHTLSLVDLGKKLKLPCFISISSKADTHVYDDKDKLTALYAQLADYLISDLEGGKAPFLGMINSGKIVPMVFGFEKISGLKTHSISGNSEMGPSRFSYQSEDHPLDGSNAGGRLKEIEMNDLMDLATLMLGCLAWGVEIPQNVVFRINPYSKLEKSKNQKKALYLTGEQIKVFNTRIRLEIANAEKLNIDDVPTALKGFSIPKLQDINAKLRNLPLDTFIPERDAHNKVIQ